LDKKKLSERDICTKFITPALEHAGWDIQDQVREEVSFTDGRIMVRGKVHTRGTPKRADYVLYYKSNLPIALIEAKDNNHTVGDGMQQALNYAETLDIPFVYSCNGDGFLEHDRTIKKGKIEKELKLNEFPSPEVLWDRYCIDKALDPNQQDIIRQDYYFNQGKSPRYYQRIAINRTIEAIAQGQNRILLVMATGTGKTLTAFQIIYRLWKAGVKKRILFLADRNILIDQTYTNDFKPFGNKMTKIKNRMVDKSYEIYLALYQGITGNDESQDIFKSFSKNFFDLILIDECHRGSAKEESRWREILEYFDLATQIGMTATPKETNKVSNIEYFGDPIYNYSLKQGIDDGFLAPYKVIRVILDKDAEGFRPYDGQTDKYGNTIPDVIYGTKDYDQNIVLEERTKTVARFVSDLLKKNSARFEKSIFFCVDIEHAERMRQALVNENSDLFSENPKYIMRITGDNDEGKKQLDNFIDSDQRYPVLVTTSKLLTTGVDAKTCKYIILDSNINSMTEFKQIIGRGTRISEEYNKTYFTIIDFRGVTRHFADSEFDGDPVMIKTSDGTTIPTEEDELIDGAADINLGSDSEDLKPDRPDITIDDFGPTKPRKYFVDQVAVAIIKERVQYIDGDGKLVTESLKDYAKRNALKSFATLDDFIARWEKSEQKTAIIQELHERGIIFDELFEEVGQSFDAFDLICHIAFDQKPLTRRERANHVKKKNYFGKYGDDAKKVLEALLEKYTDEGIENIENLDILKIIPFNQYGSPLEIVKMFGGKEKYYGAIIELEKQLYA
jgi:type I restriction enzyme R subunit